MSLNSPATSVDEPQSPSTLYAPFTAEAADAILDTLAAMQAEVLDRVYPTLEQRRYAGQSKISMHRVPHHIWVTMPGQVIQSDQAIWRNYQPDKKAEVSITFFCEHKADACPSSTTYQMGKVES